MTDDARHRAGLGFVPSEASIVGAMLERLPHSETFLIGCAVVGFWVFWAIVGHVARPTRSAGADRRDPAESQLHLLVRIQDQFGRDILSRVLAGAASSLRVAPLRPCSASSQEPLSD